MKILPLFCLSSKEIPFRLKNPKNPITFNHKRIKSENHAKASLDEVKSLLNIELL